MKSILSRMVESHFGLALRSLRTVKGISQEKLGAASSRTNIGRLERGERGVSLEKIEVLSSHLGVHPLTLLLATYSAKSSHDKGLKLWEEVRDEYASLKPINAKDT